MASLPRRLLLQSRQCASRIRSRASPKHNPQWQRPLSSTPRRCENEDTKPSSKKLSPEETTAAQLASLVADLKSLNPEVMADALRKEKFRQPYTNEKNFEKVEDFEFEEVDRRKATAGFWAEGEESMGPDEDFYGDDLTSHGHGELQQHRELREYNRLVAWEMPLLHQLAKPFELPGFETPFRFRYTSYLNESHPAANKVVVQFSPTDLSLPPTAVDKMIKLSGPRYNPSTKMVKLSCEKFDTQAQNKRFLGETIQALIAEAKDTTDTFENVPFDFRHHRPKKFHAFPKEWALTEERKKYLEEKRREAARLDDQKLNNGELIDGKTIIDTSLPFFGSEQAEQETVMVGGARGKGLR